MQQLLTPRYSLVVPVYRNEGSIDALVAAIDALHVDLGGRLEAIFVVDGSPDGSYRRLEDALPLARTPSTLVLLSRNYGSFAAIRAGLELAGGEYAAVMAADLQEPPELVSQFFRVLEGGKHDIVFGVREAREDPWMTRLTAAIFWGAYRRLVQPSVPPGGVDVFAVNRAFLDTLLELREANSSLLGLLFWMGGRREFVTYRRRERVHGKSAWTFAKKLTYLLDSVFAFTDAPVRLLLVVGLAGLTVSLLLGTVTLAAKLAGAVDVPGYAGTMLSVLFFGGLNAFGLGLVGNYAWRAYENTKQRPLSIAIRTRHFNLKSSEREETA